MKTLAIWSPRPDAQKINIISPNITLYGLPVVDISAVDFNASPLQYADAVIFVSQNAVKHALLCLSASAFTHKTIIAIGKRTAEKLTKHGITVDLIAPPPYTSEALLADFAFKQLPCNYFVIISGQGGRNILQKQLTDSGKQVEKIACYRRDKANLSIEVMIEFMNAYAIGGIILSSKEITEIVAEQLTKAQQWQAFHLPVFTLSERIAKRAQIIGFTEIFVAEKANQCNLNQHIINWWEGE